MDELVAASGLEGPSATRFRRDLVAHLLEGLAAGRTPAELRTRLGEPDQVAPLLARSPPAGPAREQGQVDFGREAWGAALRQDLRHALRTLARAPSFAATAVGVLSLGLAAAVVVSTVVNEIVLRPLPVSDPSSLVDVWAEVPGGNSFVGFAWADIRDFQEREDVPAELAGFMGTRLRLGEEGPGAREVVGQLVSANYFRLLGLEPALGRFDFPAAPAFGGEPVVVLGHDFWQGSLGGDPDILGRTLRLDGHAVRVVGVAPQGFQGTFIGFPVELWLPLTAADPLLSGWSPGDRARKPFELLGRLRPGATPEGLERSLDRAAEEMEAAHPIANAGLRVGVARTTGVDHSLRGAVTTFVAVLVALAAMVLLIACLNVGSLLLVRTMAREREVAVRLAMGAGKGRLVRSLLTESGLLMVAAMILGLFLAARLTDALREFMASISGGIGFDLSVDGRVLALTVGVTLLATLAAGLAPALYLVRKDPAGALRSRSGHGGSGTRLRAGLVVGQVAVSVVLVVVAGLFGRSVLMGSAADPGFAAGQVASFGLVVEADEAAGEATAVRDGLLAELAALPGVEAVTWATLRPLEVGRTPTRMRIPGVDPPPGQDSLVVDARGVGGGYHALMGIPLLRGREIRADEVAESAPVAVVSRAFSERFWPEGRVLGRALDVAGRTVRVVGVAEDARYVVQDRTPDPLLYLPAGLLSRGSGAGSGGQILLRSGAPLTLTQAVDARVRARLPGHPTVSLRTARAVLTEALFPQRVGVVVVGAMGLVALLLASLGLYGIVQFSVTRDRRQLGVRLALGGGPGALMRTVLRRGFLLAASGTAAGWVLAYLLSPALGPLLVETGPRDPLTFGVVGIAFLAVALLASWLPARRAMAIEPAEVLREE